MRPNAPAQGWDVHDIAAGAALSPHIAPSRRVKAFRAEHLSKPSHHGRHAATSLGTSEAELVARNHAVDWLPRKFKAWTRCAPRWQAEASTNHTLAGLG